MVCLKGQELVKEVAGVGKVMDDYQMVICSTQSQIEQCYAIRYTVFCDEQGYDRDLELDE